MKILDCTLRDGGYYTNWDFNSNVVDIYIRAMNELPIDYLEIGYRNNPSKDYLGKFGYTPVPVLKHIRAICSKKMALMLNEKSVKVEDLPYLLTPVVGLVDMIRLAIDPQNFERAVVLAKAIKKMGFEVGFNVMYMSKWTSTYDGFLQKLYMINDIADLFCMVDSFGGVTPEDVTTIYQKVKANTSCPIGFHGHNNLQLGLINAITAMKLGVDYVDATILGMGRGAGNLNMELLLAYLNAHEEMNVDFNVLGDVISAFTPLMEQYCWGTNLPYMLAGANGIPQKEVMEWVTNRVYSFNSIVRALDNRKNNEKDNAQFPLIKIGRQYDTVLVIGGGNSVVEHKEAIKSFICNQENVALVFATARHANEFLDIEVSKYYCLIGNEGRRLTEKVGAVNFDGMCVLPPYPRAMGTEVPDYANKNTTELSSVDFTSEFRDSVTTIALQLALNLSKVEIYVVGYDGYPGSVLSEKEMSLTNENKSIFGAYLMLKGKLLKSLTPSLYKELDVVSVYQFI